MNRHTKIWKKRLIEAVLPLWEIIDGLMEVFNQAGQKDKTPGFKSCAQYPSYGFLFFDVWSKVTLT
jgi:hypothetical protein